MYVYLVICDYSKIAQFLFFFFNEWITKLSKMIMIYEMRIDIRLRVFNKNAPNDFPSIIRDNNKRRRSLEMVWNGAQQRIKIVENL